MEQLFLIPRIRKTVVVWSILALTLCTQSPSVAQVATPWYTQQTATATRLDDEFAGTLSNSIRFEPEASVGSIDIVAAVVSSLVVRSSNQMLIQEAQNLPIFQLVQSRIQEDEVSYSYLVDIDRLYGEFDFNNVFLTIGRQSQDWGVGMFFRPNDVFGKLSPVAIQQEERIGIDMINAVWYLTSETDVQCMVLPRRHNNLVYGMVATRVRTRVDITDILIYLSYSRVQQNIGLDLESSIWEAGVNLEASLQTQTSNENQAAIGVSFGIDNQFELLYVSVEYAFGRHLFDGLHTSLLAQKVAHDNVSMLASTLSIPVFNDFTSMSLQGLYSSEKAGFVQLVYTSDISTNWTLAAGLGVLSILNANQRYTAIAGTVSARWYH